MNEIYVKKPQKNNFDLSHEVKMTGNMGDLLPCYIQDVIPGDSYKVDTQQLVRFSPLLAPIMHNVDFKLDYFFVPYRLVWSEWKDFITGGEDGNDLPSYPRWEVNLNNRNYYLTKGSLADYLGIPPYITPPSGQDSADTGSAWTTIGGNVATRHYLDILKFRAYQLIYHEYFRDQNVGTEYTQYTTSGIQSSATLDAQLKLRKSNWQKDYFTSALPFLQRGTEVGLPLGNVAPIVYADPGASGGDRTILQKPVSQGGLVLGGVNGNIRSDSNGQMTSTDGMATMNINVSQTHQVDLANATPVTINALRKASALQQWLELMARAGSRYREQIYAIFGEKIPDYTVQIPKYLGGGKTPIMISEILSTYENKNSGTIEDRPVGDMAGHALALGSDIGFTESFDEHGVILGLCRVIPKSSYIQGLNKFWTKFDKFDHYFPQFANLGEQEVKNSELFIRGDLASAGGNDNGVFGYQQRYAEYKYAESRVAGDFRDTLQYWHMARTFNNTPLLNQSFIECTTDDRIFAITDANEDKLWMSLYHKVSAIRPIPYFSNPSLT